MAEAGAPPKGRKRRLGELGSVLPFVPPAAATGGAMPPVERLLQLGPGSLTDTELLSIFLSRGPDDEPDPTLRAFLDLFGGIAGLIGFDLEIARAQPLGAERLVVLLAAVELGRRFQQIPVRPLLLEEPNQVAAFVVAQLHAIDQQVLGAFFADGDNRSMGFFECFRGTRRFLKLDTKVVLRQALCRKAQSLLVFRYSPTAKPAATEEDFRLCDKLADACRVMGFQLLDVLLVSTEDWLSLRSLRSW